MRHARGGKEIFVRTNNYLVLPNLVRFCWLQCHIKNDNNFQIYRSSSGNQFYKNVNVSIQKFELTSVIAV